jgi:hypothetical protein
MSFPGNCSEPRPLICSLPSSNARKTRPRVVFGESHYDKRVSLTRQVARGRALEHGKVLLNFV